jgi:hypothetical protein
MQSEKDREELDLNIILEFMLQFEEPLIAAHFEASPLGRHPLNDKNKSSLM